MSEIKNIMRSNAMSGELSGGQGMVEYVLIIALIAVVAVVGFNALGGNITAIMAYINNAFTPKPA